MRKIVAVLLLLVLCLVISPVLAAHSATDVEGTTDDKNIGYDYYEDIVKYAAKQQEAKECPAVSYLQPKTETAIDRLQQDSIFFFNGHCVPGKMGVGVDQKDPDNYRWIYGKHAPHEEKALDNLELSNLDFIFFDCCESAGMDPFHGSLTKVSIQSGAKCAFGFREDVRKLDTAIFYGHAFWDEARKGSPWPFAHEVALKAMDNDPHIKKHCESIRRPYCGYDSLDYEPKKGDGCLSHLQPNPVATKTTAPTPETPIQPPDLETANITLDQAQEIIREFTGNPNLKVKYEKSDYELSPNIYDFTIGSAYFSINSATRRVENAGNYSWDLLNVDPGETVISLDDASVIAENFAKKQRPQFWNTTDKTGIMMSKEVLEHGGSYEYIMTLREEYYYPNKNTPGHITIKGPNNIRVSVAPGGEIHSYHEYLTSRDESVSLKPDLNEDQAWAIAKERFAEEQIDIMDNDKTEHELQITRYDNKQNLAWFFFAKNNNLQSSGIAIDAHDGHVVFYIPYT